MPILSSPVLTVAPSDLGTYLNIPNIDPVRAQLMLDLASTKCQAIVNPLTPECKPVVLSVAARAFANPTNVSAESVLGQSATFGAVAGGLWLTRTEKQELLALAGRGGAFSIDTCPATAGQNLPPWANGQYTDPGIFGIYGGLW